MNLNIVGIGDIRTNKGGIGSAGAVPLEQLNRFALHGGIKPGNDLFSNTVRNCLLGESRTAGIGIIAAAVFRVGQQINDSVQLTADAGYTG